MLSVKNASFVNLNTGNFYGNSSNNQTIYNINYTNEEDILKTPQHFGIPINFPEIVGRDTNVEELYKEVIENETRIVISGVSGVGKTFLALHCAKRWSPPTKNHSVKHVVFFSCETKNVFRESVDALATLLKIKTSVEIGLLETFRQICLKFGEDKCLFIYDNVDNPEIIRLYLPDEYMKNFFVIASSQLEKWGDLINSYKLKMMDCGEARELIFHKLNKKYRSKVSELSYMFLIKTFDGYPLGLTHATAFINNKLDDELDEPDISAIIDKYIKQINDFMKEDLPGVSKELYRRSVTAAILINFNKISEDKYFKQKSLNLVFEKLTQFFAFGNPEQTKSKILYIMTKLGVTEEEITESIRIFVKYSVIDVQKYTSEKTEKNSFFLSIHRTVQFVIRDTFQNKQVIQIICELIRCFESIGFYPNIDFWCSHINENAVLSCAENEWKQICTLLVTTPKTKQIIDFVIHFLSKEKKNEQCKKYLDTFCEILMLNGNIYVYKNCIGIGKTDKTFVETFDKTLAKYNRSISVWNNEINILESKLKILGYFFGHFNNTYDCWEDIHWYAWWNWIDKLKQFKSEQFLTPGWNKWTVVHVGSLKGNVEILNLIPEENLKGFCDEGISLSSGFKNGRTVNAVELATYFKNLNYLKILLDNGWSPKISNPYNYNYLNEVKLAKILMDHGTDINNLDIKNAICFGEVEVIKFLLQQKVALNSLDKFEQAALYSLVQSNIIDENPFDFEIDCKEYVNNFIIHWAADYGLINVIKMLLQKRININQVNKLGNTALHNAVIKNNTETARFLLENGAKVNAKNNYENTPLHLIDKETKIDMIELFLKHKFKINTLNKSKQNVLISAVKCGNLEVTEELLKKGINSKIIDSCHYTGLQYAVKQSNINIVNLLLSYGSDINFCDCNSESTLSLSILQYNIDMVKFLLDNKADVNLRSLFGNTPLHWAVRTCSIDIVKLLIEFKADPNLANKNGETALHYIMNGLLYQPINEIQIVEILKILIKNGADVNAIDNNGKKPIELTSNLKNFEIYRILNTHTIDKRISYFDKDYFYPNNSLCNSKKINFIISFLIVIVAYFIYLVLL